MSVIYSLDELSDEMKKELCKELTLIPVDPYVEKMKTYGRHKEIQNLPAKIPLILFKVDKEKRTVKFPFFTIKEKSGVKPNRDREFPRLKKEGLPVFKAELRDYQQDAAQEAFLQLKEHATTTLGFPPGWGKTILGAWLAGKCNGPCLVLVHRMQIAEAWVKTFQTCFPQYAKSILLVGESDFQQGIKLPNKCKNSENLFKKDETGKIVSIDSNTFKCGTCKNCKKEDVFVPCFTICMYQRLKNVPEHIKNAIKVLIIDEAHLFCTHDKIEPILETQPQFIIIETATLNRPDNMHIMMHKFAGEHCVKREPTKPFRLYKVLTGIKFETVQGKRGIDFNLFTQELINNDNRNQIILNLIKSNEHRKIICLGRQKSHVLLLKDLLDVNNIECDTLFGNKKTYNDSHVLLGTIPKMGVGFDEANIIKNLTRVSDLLILLTSIAQIELFQQVIGRVMRSKDPAILYLIDDMSISKRHYKNVEETIYNSKGLIFEIDIEDEDADLFIPDCEYNKKGECVVVKNRN